MVSSTRRKWRCAFGGVARTLYRSGSLPNRQAVETAPRPACADRGVPPSPKPGGRRRPAKPGPRRRDPSPIRSSGTRRPRRAILLPHCPLDRWFAPSAGDAASGPRRVHFGVRPADLAESVSRRESPGLLDRAPRRRRALEGASRRESLLAPPQGRRDPATVHRWVSPLHTGSPFRPRASPSPGSGRRRPRGLACGPRSLDGTHRTPTLCARISGDAS